MITVVITQQTVFKTFHKFYFLEKKTYIAKNNSYLHRLKTARKPKMVEFEYCTYTKKGNAVTFLLFEQLTMELLTPWHY